MLYGLLTVRSKMSQEKKLERIDKENLPIFYKIIMKVPLPSFDTSVTIPSGIFWAIVFPIFIILELFLNLYLIVTFDFPVSLLLICIFPLAFLVVFIRVTLERFINWWNSAVVGGYTPKDLRETLEEYIAIRKARHKKKAIRE